MQDISVVTGLLTTWIIGLAILGIIIGILYYRYQFGLTFRIAGLFLTIAFFTDLVAYSVARVGFSAGFNIWENPLLIFGFVGVCIAIYGVIIYYLFTFTFEFRMFEYNGIFENG